MNPQPDSELTTKIEAVLNGFRRSSDKPPMSLEEIAVAIIAINQEMTLVELQRHILTAFKYYNNASVEGSITRGYRGSIIISNFNTTFDTLLRRFDLPIDVYRYESDDEDDDDNDELRVSPCAAQIFLHKHLTDRKMEKKKTPFPFLKLPAEIRLQIYGHCLGLPKSGVCVRQAQRHEKKKEIVVRSKDFDAELQISDWKDVPAANGVRARWDNYEFRNRHDGTFKCQKLRTHLALLSVNKEISNEAMPVFYSINSFVCSDLFHLEDFLATLAPERREQLRHISFFYTKTTHSKAAKAFKMLGEIEKLKRLDIVIDEADFVGLTKGKGERMFPDMLKLPGFHTLRSMRAVKTVQFHGRCDTIRAALQSWVVDNEIKAEPPKKPKKPKKRATTKAKVAKKIKKAADVEQDDEQEESSLFGLPAGVDPSEVDENDSAETDNTNDPFRDTALNSSTLSGHYFDAVSPKPSTPRTSGGLLSPFKFKPSNSRSDLTGPFQPQSPSFGRGNGHFANFDETAMVSGASTQSAPHFTQHNQQGFGQNNTANPSMSYQEGYRPVPNIATRLLMHGPGQMFDWKPVKPREYGEEMWADTNQTSQGTMAGASTKMPDAEAFHPESGMMSMDDLMETRDDYELIQ